MFPNYSYYQPQSNFRQPQQQQFLKGYPVSSLEEVKATGIDFDGSIFFFPDIANKKIYTKQINADGTASLNMYELTPIPEPTNTNNFITREEFNQSLQELKNALAASKNSNSNVNQNQENKNNLQF